MDTYPQIAHSTQSAVDGRRSTVTRKLSLFLAAMTAATAYLQQVQKSEYEKGKKVKVIHDGGEMTGEDCVGSDSD